MNEVLHLYWIALQWVGLVTWGIVLFIAACGVAIPFLAIAFGNGDGVGAALLLMLGSALVLAVFGIPFYVLVYQPNWMPS